MITRVWGSVEGTEIIFTPVGNDSWQCKVPKTLDGEYVVELFAEDDSGNVSYAATILFTIDAKHLTFTVKTLDIPYDIQGKVRDYTMNVIRCEVCGGDMYATR